MSVGASSSGVTRPSPRRKALLAHENSGGGIWCGRAFALRSH
ncbi:hypothetical protein ACVINI_003228 [Rhizobium beringeri]